MLDGKAWLWTSQLHPHQTIYTLMNHALGTAMFEGVRGRGHHQAVSTFQLFIQCKNHKKKKSQKSQNIKRQRAGVLDRPF